MTFTHIFSNGQVEELWIELTRPSDFIYVVLQEMDQLHFLVPEDMRDELIFWQWHLVQWVDDNRDLFKFHK